MLIETIPIEDIRPAVYNPRKDLQPTDPEYQKLRKSIAEFDLVEPLVWNRRSGNLIGGHQRLKILKEQGHTEVEVSVVDMDATREKALNLALNKISGEWDMPMLKDLLQELDTGEMDMEITGFDLKEIEDLMAQFHVPGDGLTDDDAIPENVETICKTGDLWILGNHRLLCGDSTLKADVDRLMDGQKADMVLADPPYNVNYRGGSRDRSDVYPDVFADYRGFLTAVLDNAHQTSSDKAALHLWHSTGELRNVLASLDATRWIDRSFIIWDKGCVKGGLGQRCKQYRTQFEPCVYCHKKGHIPNWHGPGNESNVWAQKGPSVSPLHPTMKPVELYAKSLTNHTLLHEIVLECFGGSGTTLIACEKLGRRCYMMEIDEHYCDVIIARYEAFTGREAVLLDKA